MPNDLIITRQEKSDEPVNYTRKIYHLLVGIVIVFVIVNVLAILTVLYIREVLVPEQRRAVEQGAQSAYDKWVAQAPIPVPQSRADLCVNEMHYKAVAGGANYNPPDCQ